MGYGFKERSSTTYNSGNTYSQFEIELSGGNPVQEQWKSIDQSHNQSFRMNGDQQTGDNYSYNLVSDRNKQEIGPPKRYGQTNLIWYALNIAKLVEQREPSTYKKVVTSKKMDKCIEAMYEEMTSLMKNNTWNLVDNQVEGEHLTANGYTS